MNADQIIARLAQRIARLIVEVEILQQKLIEKEAADNVSNEQNPEP